jgi:predicted RNase H-like nuclease
VTFVGIDGCKSGWIAVVLAPDGSVTAHHLPHIEAVTTAVPDAEVIAIDIPIGLPVAGQREADLAAKSFLGPQRNTIFFTPVRSAVEAATHAEATAASVLETSKGISQQAFALAPKILQVERWLPTAPCRVAEVHPEVSFRELIGYPIASKKTWAGMVERRRALAGVGIDLEDIDALAARAAAVDDVLDAAVVAWTAGRIAAGTARSFPAGATPADPAIWA